MAEKLRWVRDRWVILLLGGLIVGFLFNGSFRSTLHRHKLIKQSQLEYSGLSLQIDQLKHKIKKLESNPSSMETMVRQELGYIKPGEKEVRFQPAER